MKKLDNLEKLLGKKYSDWSLEDLKTISNNKEMEELFTPEVVIYLLDNSTNNNQDIIDVLKSIRFDSQINAIKFTINEALKQYNENGCNKNNLELALKNMMNDPAYLIRFGAYLTILSLRKDGKGNSFININILDKESDIRNIFKKIKENIYELKPDTGFYPLTSILDMMFTLRENFFQEYNIDTFTKDDKKFVKFLEDYDDFSKINLDYENYTIDKISFDKDGGKE